MDNLEYIMSGVVGYIVRKVSWKHSTEQWYEMNILPVNVNAWAECQDRHFLFLNYYDRRGDELSSVNVDVQGQIFPFDGSGHLVLILTWANYSSISFLATAMKLNEWNSLIRLADCEALVLVSKSTQSHTCKHFGIYSFILTFVDAVKFSVE